MFRIQLGKVSNVLQKSSDDNKREKRTEGEGEIERNLKVSVIRRLLFSMWGF